MIRNLITVGSLGGKTIKMCTSGRNKMNPKEKSEKQGEMVKKLTDKASC